MAQEDDPFETVVITVDSTNLRFFTVLGFHL